MKVCYLTDKQNSFLQAKQKVKTWLGGRGSGKTTVAGASNYMTVLAMPQSRSCIVGNTLRHLWNNELPPRIQYWTQTLGLTQVTKSNSYGHFIVGMQPPKYFKLPSKPPKMYDNSITFINGACFDLVSMNIKEGGRGGNYDSGELCEASTVNRDLFWTVYFPAVRGPHRSRYSKTQPYLSWNIFGNMPYTRAGKWLYEEMESKAQKNAKRFFFQESTIWDAIEIYGEDYILETKQLIESINPSIWAVEYMNERKLRADNPFYSYYDDAVHGYYNDRNIDPHYNTFMPLAVSIDFNHYFNSMTVWQNNASTHFCLNEFFVKGNYLLSDLLAKFINRYKHHQNKEVHLYGDIMGIYKMYNESMNLFQAIKEVLEKAGWYVVNRIEGRIENPAHILKQQRINTLLKETNPALPLVRFNLDECHNTIDSIKQSPLTRSFKKDKSSERRKENRETATDLSDTVDYYLFVATDELFHYSDFGSIDIL